MQIFVFLFKIAPPPLTPQIFRPLQIFYPFKPEDSFFRLYRPRKCFLTLKNLFFRPKNPFLDFLDLKISLNPLKTLRKHLFNLQIDEKNNIVLDFIAKNCPSHDSCVLHGNS